MPKHERLSKEAPTGLRITYGLGPAPHRTLGLPSELLIGLHQVPDEARQPV